MDVNLQGVGGGVSKAWKDVNLQGVGWVGGGGGVVRGGGGLKRGC